MKGRIIIAAGVAALALQGGALAQDGIEEEEAGVTVLNALDVTANRTPTEKSKVGSKVDRVEQAEIDEKSQPHLLDYLSRVPGVAITQTGGPGQLTSFFLRGLPNRYVKALYNGIDISDPSNTQVQTHWEHLLTGGLSSIEVLKGSQSTLYGANAIAGVVDVSTLNDVPHGIRHVIETEGGSFGTVRGRYGFTAANESTKAAGNITGYRTSGISAAAGGAERDGYQNVTADLNVEHRINEAFSVFGSLLYSDTKADYDNPPVDSLVHRATGETLAGRAGFNLDLMDGRLKNTFSVQASKIDRYHVPDNWRYVGKRQKFDYQGSFEATDWLLLQYGADHERQQADIDAWVTFSGAHRLTGVWAQAVVEPVSDFVLTAGLRHDQHSEFGGHTTYRGTASYLFAATGTRLHASVGTGFRAPNLFELYDPWSGNPNLEPEKSRSFDIGVEQQFLGGMLVTDLTYFQLAVDNLIEWSGGAYNQVPGTTRSKGVEASFTYRASDWLDLGGSYTYTHSRTPTGIRSIRVPKHAFVLSATVRPAENWTVTADIRHVHDTLDTDWGIPADVPLKNYTLLNAKVSYQMNETTELYVRGENLLNQKYQTAIGYGTPGIAGYVGMKARF